MEEKNLIRNPNDKTQLRGKKKVKKCQFFFMGWPGRPQEQLYVLLLCWPALRHAARDVRRLVFGHLQFESWRDRMRREMGAEMMEKEDREGLDRVVRAVQFRRNDGTFWLVDWRKTAFCFAEKKKNFAEASLVAGVGPLTATNLRRVTIRCDEVVARIVSAMDECGLQLQMASNARKVRCFLFYGCIWSERFTEFPKIFRACTLGRLLEMTCNYSVYTAVKHRSEGARSAFSKAHINVDEWLWLTSKDPGIDKVISKLDAAGILQRTSFDAKGLVLWLPSHLFSDNRGVCSLQEGRHVSAALAWATRLLARKNDFDLFLLADNGELQRLPDILKLIGEDSLARRIQLFNGHTHPAHRAWLGWRITSFDGVLENRAIRERLSVEEARNSAFLGVCLKHGNVSVLPFEKDHWNRSAASRILETFRLLDGIVKKPCGEAPYTTIGQEEAELALKLAQMPSAVHKTVSAAEVSHFFKPLMHLTDATRDYLRRYRGPCGETRLKLLNSIKNVLEQGMKIAQIA